MAITCPNGNKSHHHYSIQKKSQVPLECTTPKDRHLKNPASIGSCLTTSSQKIYLKMIIAYFTKFGKRMGEETEPSK